MSPCCPESLTKIRIFNQLREGGGEGARVAWRHNQADLAIDYQLLVASAIGCNHRPSHRHGLANGAGDSGAGPGGINHHIACSEHLGHVRAIGQRHDPVGETGLTCSFFDLYPLALRFASNEEETYSERLRCKEGEGRHEIGPSLPVPNRHLANHDVIGIDPELVPQRRPVGVRGIEDCGVGTTVDRVG